MILRGILDNSLNGQLCIRGFAPIKELARISEADYSYQRNPIEGREDIIDFLERQTYLFFPEILLSYKIKHSFDNSKSENTPLQTIQSNKRYKSDIDETQILVKSVDYKNGSDVRGLSKVKILELIINDSEFLKERKPFHRIDGNHRLKAAEHSESPKVERMVAPFCIILGEEFYKNGTILPSSETENFDKAVKVFFHNINTRTIPLTSEENLKVLIDDSKNFADEELEEILGLEALMTRQLIQHVKPTFFTGFSHILSDRYRTFYMDVFRKLLQKNDASSKLVEKVFESLKAVDQLYTENSSLKTNTNFGLLTAFLYYHIEDKIGKYNFFKEWVFNNHIFEINEIKANSIIRIFDKIAAQELKVFVAMPYFENDSEQVEEHNRVYKDEIKKIAEKYKIKITPYDIMQNKGATQDQIQDIINKIQSCSIFISDITGNNANVLYEMGWARALKKPTIIVREKDSEKPKSDYSNDTYHVYKKTSLSTTLGKIINENLIEVLSKNFGLINIDSN